MSIKCIKTAVIAGLGESVNSGAVRKLCKASDYNFVNLPASLDMSDTADKERLFEYLDSGSAGFIVNVLGGGEIADQLNLTLELLEADMPMLVLFDPAYRPLSPAESRSLSDKLGVPVFVCGTRDTAHCMEMVSYLDSYSSFLGMCCDPASCNISTYMHECRRCVRFMAKTNFVPYGMMEGTIAKIAEVVGGTRARRNALRIIEFGRLNGFSEDKAEVCGLILYDFKTEHGLDASEMLKICRQGIAEEISAYFAPEKSVFGIFAKMFSKRFSVRLNY